MKIKISNATKDIFVVLSLTHMHCHYLNWAYTIPVAVNFCFSFVLNSLAYIAIPKNNGKIKIN